MALNSGTQALSTTAVNLGNGPCRGVQVHNNDAAIAILVGNAGAQNYTVAPGGSTGRIEVGNRNMVYVKSASGTPTCSWLTD
jgi:hypothetical protein